MQHFKYSIERTGKLLNAKETTSLVELLGIDKALDTWAKGLSVLVNTENYYGLTWQKVTKHFLCKEDHSRYINDWLTATENPTLIEVSKVTGGFKAEYVTVPRHINFITGGLKPVWALGTLFKGGPIGWAATTKKEQVKAAADKILSEQGTRSNTPEDFILRDEMLFCPEVDTEVRKWLRDRLTEFADTAQTLILTGCTTREQAEAQTKKAPMRVNFDKFGNYGFFDREGNLRLRVSSFDSTQTDNDDLDSEDIFSLQNLVRPGCTTPEQTKCQAEDQCNKSPTTFNYGEFDSEGVLRCRRGSFGFTPEPDSGGAEYVVAKGQRAGNMQPIPSQDGEPETPLTPAKAGGVSVRVVNVEVRPEFKRIPVYTPTLDKLIKYLGHAQAAAALSKDPSTKVGAVAIDDHFAVVAEGRNGFPRGVHDCPAKLNDRPTKYAHTVHAEANLVAYAARRGVSLANTHVLLTELLPCSSCAGLLIQAGVSSVLAPEEVANSRWDDSSSVAVGMLLEAGVEVITYKQVGDGFEFFTLMQE